MEAAFTAHQVRGRCALGEALQCFLLLVGQEALIVTEPSQCAAYTNLDNGGERG